MTNNTEKKIEDQINSIFKNFDESDMSKTQLMVQLFELGLNVKQVWALPRMKGVVNQYQHVYNSWTKWSKTNEVKVLKMKIAEYEDLLKKNNIEF